MLSLRRSSSVVFVNMKKFTYALFTMNVHECAEAGTKAQNTHRHRQRENVEKKKIVTETSDKTNSRFSSRAVKFVRYS